MHMTSKRIEVAACWALAVLLFLSGAHFSWAQDQSRAVVVSAIKHVVSPPLSQIAPIPPRAHASAFSGDADASIREPQSASSLQDSTLQLSLGADARSAISTNSGLDILGIGNGFPGYTEQANIPVANGAAGATQYVQFVNESFAVFNKSTGSLIYGPADGDTLWTALGPPCSNTQDLDEIAQYDKLANVWVMMRPLYTNPPYFCIAVSTTSDATGSWNEYVFEIPANTTGCKCRPMPDYPKLGVWPDAYYIAFDQANYLIYQGPEACAVKRSAMLSGAAATMQCFPDYGATNGVLLPADVDGITPPTSGEPEYFLTLDANFQSLGLWEFHVNWTTPANSTFTNTANIPVTAFTEPCGDTSTILFTPQDNCVPQAGTTEMLGAFGSFLMYRLAYRNFGTYEDLVANHTVQVGTSSNQTGIDWYELRNTGSGSAFGVYQQGTYAPDSNYRWMGSIAMDKVGDIALGYNVSSSSMSPSIRYTGRVPTDALGTMDSEVDILSSAGVATASQTNSVRWGDYSSMAIDPTDDCTFWYTNEYQPAGGNNRWATRIASFSFPSCTGTQSYTLTVNEVGQGTVTSSDGEINCTNGSGTCSAVYTTGTAVTLNATAPSGWNFTSWSGSCTGGNPCNVVVNNNLTETATFSTNWALVNKASVSGNPASSLTIPATGSGNLIAVAILFNPKTSVTSVSDNAGNTYVSAGARAVNGGLNSEIWYAVNSKAGATVITPAFGTSPTHEEITEWEVAGLSTGVPDAAGTLSGKITLNNTTGPAVTTTQAGDFIVADMFAVSTNLTSMSSGNAFTDDFTTDGNGWAHITSNSTSAGTYQPSWYTASPAGGFCASTVAFKLNP
jgi:hypothetical protein